MPTTHENSGPDACHAELARAIAHALSDREILQATRNLLTDAQKEIDRLGIHCKACGTCCNFQAAGHRLYVTTAELALLAKTSTPPVAPLKCPFLHDSQCHARERRALGCRTFYCEGGSAAPLAIYETWHERLRSLHETRGVQYFYVEMTAGLTIYKNNV